MKLGGELEGYLGLFMYHHPQPPNEGVLVPPPPLLLLDATVRISVCASEMRAIYRQRRIQLVA